MINKKIRIYPAIFIGIFLLLPISCKKEDKNLLPTLTTSELSYRTFNSATCGGSITNDGGAIVTARGVCWSMQPNPTIDDVNEPDTIGGTGQFTINLTSLTNNTTLFVRAYATSSEGTAYGEEISFVLWLNAPDISATDIDNNSYSSVKIGNQVWMQENLFVTHYRNGDPIQNITKLNDEQWINAVTGAYCDYDDSDENAGLYGHLYNWYAVNDSRKICPAGWHIPTRDDWQTLIEYLGNNIETVGILKSKGLSESLWKEPNTVSNYESGFSALPGGGRISLLFSPTNSVYANKESEGLWWSITEYSGSYPDLAYFFSIDSFGPALVDFNSNKITGLSIRCIKD
jgi:uncharacterized protein (TIGR02145 family)